MTKTCRSKSRSRSRKDFLKIIFYRVFYILQYNTGMLRELGLAVLVRGIRTRSPVVAVGSLVSSHHWSLTSSVNTSQAGRPYCSHRNPPDRGVEAFHLPPSHSSSLPSLDYRREPILPYKRCLKSQEPEPIRLV